MIGAAPPTSSAAATARRDRAAERRARASEMYLAGLTEAEIAAVEGVHRSTISRDLARWEKALWSTAIADLHAAKMRELARIDAAEREYWEAWRRSQEQGRRERDEVERPRTSAAAEAPADGTSEAAAPVKTKRTREWWSRDGDPAYLAGVMRCVDARIRLLGLDRLAEQGEGETVHALLSSLADLRSRSTEDAQPDVAPAPAESPR